MTSRPRRGAVAAVAAVVALAAFASATLTASAFGQSSSSSPTQQSTFIYAGTDQQSSLNPMVGYNSNDYIVWALSYSLPIEFGVKDFGPDYQHSIVTSVDASSDGMTFTYHMRSGMKWSDGQPFTANDVAWSYTYYIKNNVPNFSSDLSLVDTVTAPDGTTFVITSKQPTSFYSGKSVFLYDYILPEHIWSKYDNDYKAARQVSNVPNIGSGPYVISENKPGQSVTLVRNPYYWGTSIGFTPNYDRIVYVVYNNQDALAAALQNGEIDFGFFSSGNILKALSGNPKIVTRGGIIPQWDEIGINDGSAYESASPDGKFKPHGDGAKALTDPIVRRAIRQAVDGQTLVDKVLLGYGQPADSPVQPDATTGDWDPPASDALPFDIAAANQKLDAAGYKMGSDGVRIDPSTGKPLEFRYFTVNSIQNTIETAPYVQDWLSQIGIKIDVSAISEAKLATALKEGDYDLFNGSYGLNPDPNFILGAYTCDQRPMPDRYDNSDSYYCNPAYDKLYQEQRAEPDATKRADIVHEMQAILYRDQPNIILYYNTYQQGYRADRVTGFTPQPADNGAIKGDLLATFGPLSFISIRPASASVGGTAAKGASSTVWIVIAAVLAVLVGGFVLMRRRRPEHDEEGE